MSIKLIIGLILLALLTGGLFYINALREDVSVLKTEKMTLQGQIKNQNDSIMALKTESDKRAKEGALLIQEASKQAQIRYVAGKTIYKTLPSVKGDDCKSALALMQ